MDQMSLMAWVQIYNDLGRRQRVVLEAIKRRPNSNNREIAESLGLPINTVTPRVKELRSLGVVINSGYKIDVKTKKKTNTWRVN